MQIKELELEGVLLLEPKYFEDYRGYYSETYSKRTMSELGIDIEFVQDNHAYSEKKGTLRGVHFQNNPMAQTKLVRVVSGKVLDFVVDLRKNSPTYLKWICEELSYENRKQLLIPKGFGHSVLTLSDNVNFLYKVDSLYDPTLDRAIAYNDEDINIDWQFEKYGIVEPIISQKDIKAPKLKDSDVNF